MKLTLTLGTVLVSVRGRSAVYKPLKVWRRGEDPATEVVNLFKSKGLRDTLASLTSLSVEKEIISSLESCNQSRTTRIIAANKKIDVAPSALFSETNDSIPKPYS